MFGFGDLNLIFRLLFVILVFMSNLNFMLSRDVHEKSFTTLGPVTRVSYQIMTQTGRPSWGVKF